MENKSHRGNYKGTTAMKAKNQDMAFVNDTIEGAKSVTPFSEKKKRRTSSVLPASNVQLCIHIITCPIDLPVSPKVGLT